jgi:hypothetical protein
MAAAGPFAAVLGGNMGAIVKTLSDAIEEISNLPAEDQETIGRDLLSHVEQLRRLRFEIDKGIRSLDEHGGTTLNIEEFLGKANARHGGP